MFTASHMAFTQINSIHEEPNLIISSNSWGHSYICLLFFQRLKKSEFKINSYCENSGVEI